jgi:hypothetical protein
VPSITPSEGLHFRAAQGRPRGADGALVEVKPARANSTSVAADATSLQ